MHWTDRGLSLGQKRSLLIQQALGLFQGFDRPFNLLFQLPQLPDCSGTLLDHSQRRDSII